MHDTLVQILQINWFILAAGLIFGVFYSIVRIIPKKEE